MPGWPRSTRPGRLSVASGGSELTVPHTIIIGSVVRTSYGTGPYVIREIHGPCECPEYLRSLDGDDTPSEPHFHLTCERVDDVKGDYWLNGYRPDGTSVWTSDRLEFVGVAAGQIGLFDLTESPRNVQ